MKNNTKNIRKRITAVLFAVMMVVTVLAVAPVVSATVTVYADDRPEWESAVGVYGEEFFTDATLNPGVSVVTDNGYVDISSGVWWDRLVCPAYGLTTTTWSFAAPITAFGGEWNPYVPGGPGASIDVAINGGWVTVGEIPATYDHQFWGFVSTVPFSAVRLSPGSTCNGAWCETYELDDMVYNYMVPVYVDIKPGSCPNPLNTKSKGVLPVAVLGTEEFDVTTIDPTTIRLEEVEPIRWDYEDVATPFEGELCDCNDLDGDGYEDLTLKFDTQDLVEELDLEPGDEVVILTLTGKLTSGAAIEGADCIFVL